MGSAAQLAAPLSESCEGTLMKARLRGALNNASRDLANPHLAWQVLLQKKVPLTVLTTCCELLPVCHTAAFTAAGLLLLAAAAGLQWIPASSPHTSTSTGSSSSSSNSLKALFWAQLEQSSFLQQLPGLFSSTILALQTCSPDTMADEPLSDGPLDGSVSPHTVDQLLSTLSSISRLQPSPWLTTSPAVQQCLLPAMQLAMLALQHIDKAIAAGAQPHWYEGWLGMVWNAVDTATVAIVGMLDTHLKQQQQTLANSGGSSILGSLLAAAASSSSRAGPASEIAAVLEAEQTMQCCCLEAVTCMLVQWLGLKPQTDAAGCASARGQWLPAVLASSMPAAYSTMLEQLGCSREMGLWLAMTLQSTSSGPELVQTTDESPAPSKAAQREALAQLKDYALTMVKCYYTIVRAMNSIDMVPPRRLAAMQLCMPAATLQWLLGMPPRGLLGTMPSGSTPACVAVSACTEVLCKDGCVLMTLHRRTAAEQPPPLQQQQQQQQHDTADLATMWAVHQLIVSLSVAVLDKLVGMCRASPSSAGAAPGCAGGGSSSSSSSAAGSSSARGAGSSGRRGGRAQLCALLQEFLRLATAAGAAAAAAVPTQAAAASNELSEVLGAFHMLLCKSGDTDVVSLHDVRLQGGPLVASLAAAGDVSSPDALGVFGVLCALLKVYSNPALLAALLASREGAVRLSLISTAVSAANATMLGAALSYDQTGSGPVSGGSSNGNGAAALPWLVLLGRNCLAYAALAQHRHGMNVLQSDASRSLWRAAWWLQQHALGMNLQHLQPSLASAAQWLSAAGPAQQLTALGYQPQELQQQLAKAAAALGPISRPLEAAHLFREDGPDPELASSTLEAVHEQLQAAGRALTCFAIPHACNNPACANVSGPSEAQLVGGRSCICAGCLTARYCGRDCQRQAWRQHKPVCKALAAAAAAPAASPAAAMVPAASVAPS